MARRLLPLASNDVTVNGWMVLCQDKKVLKTDKMLETPLSAPPEGGLERLSSDISPLVSLVSPVLCGCAVCGCAVRLSV